MYDKELLLVSMIVDVVEVFIGCSLKIVWEYGVKRVVYELNVSFFEEFFIFVLWFN